VIQILFAIEDVKAQIHRSFFVEDSEAAAVRSFAQLANDNNAVALYPDDFRLVRLARIDQLTGEVLASREVIGFASQYKKPSAQLELKGMDPRADRDLLKAVE